MISDLTPEEVCESLKLCDPKNLAAQRPLFQKIVAVPKMDAEGKETCALCEYVLHFLQQVITNPKAEVSTLIFIEFWKKNLKNYFLAIWNFETVHQEFNFLINCQYLKNLIDFVVSFVM